MPAPVPAGCWVDADLPPEAPLAMPVQDIHAAPAPMLRRHTAAAMRWRRAMILGGGCAIGMAASCGVAAALAVNGFDIIDQMIALLSLVLFTWLGIGFLTAMAGFALLLRAGTGGPPLRLPSRPVAVLIPICNEDIAPLAARIARMTASLDAAGASGSFDFFVLSDSGELAEAGERSACRSLRERTRAPIRYRRRPRNHARKPGNIAEWVRRFGGGHDAMIVLDADSVMTAETMLRLAAALEDDPSLGLVQTNPRLLAARTLFARWQQFAASLYGPVSSAGLAWWSGDEATFWGHNAILRVRAFAESCGLPELSGPEPFGGHIMSHDMVEAALLRRRGWGCRMLVVNEGSYEESPPTLVDHGVRDRRWCQGNLQHLRLLDGGGFHWMSRLQLLMGASAYLAAPLWLALLALGMIAAFRSGTSVTGLGTPMWLAALTIVLLFGPKLAGLAWAARDRAAAASLGGWRRIWRGVAVEVPLSILAAPIVMVSQCIAIVEILQGRPSGWGAQRRHTDGIELGEALDRYRWHMLLGLMFWMAALSEVGGAMWGLPVALGLLGAPFFATITSRADIGGVAERHGIFVADARDDGHAGSFDANRAEASAQAAGVAA